MLLKNWIKNEYEYPKGKAHVFVTPTVLALCLAHRRPETNMNGWMNETIAEVILNVLNKTSVWRDL